MKEIVLSKIQKSANGCWNWIGYIRPDGYGEVCINWKKWLSHRLSYTAFRGPIPKGLCIDHLCRNRRCVNPDHLEAVTRVENTLRGTSQFGINHQKTHCKNGHALTGENLKINKYGERKCKTCLKAWHRAYRLKNAEKFRQRDKKRYYETDRRFYHRKLRNIPPEKFRIH